jgi:hypothetical protein
MIVKKAINMAKMMDIPIIGLVENMSHTVCPHCGKEIALFGESHTEQVAADFGIPYLGSMPVDPDLADWLTRGILREFTRIISAKQLLLSRNCQSMADHMWNKMLMSLKKSTNNSNDDNKQEAMKMRLAVAIEAGEVAQHFGHCEGFQIIDIENSTL